MDQMRPAGTPAVTRILKRWLDVAGAAVGLILFSPALALIALTVKATSPGPVIFRQERVGRDGRHFLIWKFRTMVVNGKSDTLCTREDPRVTPVGAILRRHKLDELPQLVNVLRGDMALVGPRPELPSLMIYYTQRQRDIICSVRPGMTDYASILFREESEMLSEATDPEAYYRDVIMQMKFDQYRRYVQDIGLLTDLKIMLATVSLLATGRIPKWAGIARPAHAWP